MRNFNTSFQRLPSHPLVRFALVLGGLAILALSFFIGLVFLAVAAGLAILGGIGLTIRNWLTGLRRPEGREDDSLRVEYRVIRTERDKEQS